MYLDGVHRARTPSKNIACLSFVVILDNTILFIAIYIV
jgi:hypothetical protein